MRVRPMSEVGLENCPNPNHWERRDGDVVLEHPVMGSIVSVAVCNDDGTPRYDQFLHTEPIGAITVPVNTEGEIGLIEIERVSFKFGAEQVWPITDFSALGEVSIEIPRGAPRKGEAAKQTALREGQEELNSPILSVEQIGMLTPNTTFHPHRIPVYHVRVDHRREGPIPLDVNERILKVRWHPEAQVRDLIRRGKIYCAMTLAALAMHLARA